jgi:hypothetical protein
VERFGRFFLKLRCLDATVEREISPRSQRHTRIGINDSKFFRLIEKQLKDGSSDRPNLFLPCLGHASRRIKFRDTRSSSGDPGLRYAIWVFSKDFDNTGHFDYTVCEPWTCEIHSTIKKFGSFQKYHSCREGRIISWENFLLTQEETCF